MCPKAFELNEMQVVQPTGAGSRLLCFFEQSLNRFSLLLSRIVSLCMAVRMKSYTIPYAVLTTNGEPINMMNFQIA